MITQKYLPIGKRRSGLKLLGVKFIVAHDTGNPNSTAEGNVNYYASTYNEAEQSAHTFVDDKVIIECVPQNEKAYHVRRIVDTDNQLFGFDAIDWALAVELCYFDDIERSRNAYKSYVAYIRDLCTKYGLNPLNSVVGHYKLDPTRRTDPLNAFKKIGKTWEDFIKDLSVPLAETPKSIIIKRIVELEQKIGELRQLTQQL